MAQSCRHININTLTRDVTGYWSITVQIRKSGVKLKCCVKAAKSVLGYYNHTHMHTEQ